MRLKKTDRPTTTIRVYKSDFDFLMKNFHKQFGETAADVLEVALNLVRSSGKKGAVHECKKKNAGGAA